MQAYIVRRLLAALPVLFIVVLIVFALLRLTPGDPARVIAGIEGTDQQVEDIRRGLGLDKSIPVQLWIYIKDILTGNLGESIGSRVPVSRLIWERIPVTLSLTLLTELLAVGIAVPLGVLAAWKANSWIDRTVMVLSTLGFSVPLFFLGFLFIIVFGVKLHLFPVAGYAPLSEGIGDYLRHLALPATATALVIMALIARMTRSSMLEVLREEYVRTAKAKGLSDRLILVRHALRNAALPIVTVIGLGFAGLLTGVVVTENVFAIPGLGRLIVSAMLARDYPVIQAGILLGSAVMVFVNLAIDISYAFFDPRIRY